MNLKSLINRENPVIFEIGCNDGTDTQRFLDLIPTAQIYCFEPDRRAIRKFRERITRNMHVFLFEMAVSDTYGTELFYPCSPDKSWDMSGSLLRPKEHVVCHPRIEFAKEPIHVETITLDKFTSYYGIKRIDFMWMDVQGAEAKVIRGGRYTFNNIVDYLYTEYCAVELYENAPPKEHILDMLETYELVEDMPEGSWSGNMLLRNTSMYSQLGAAIG